LPAAPQPAIHTKTIDAPTARHFIVRSTIQALLLHQNRCESTGPPTFTRALTISRQPLKHPRGKKLLVSNAVHRIGRAPTRAIADRIDTLALEGKCDPLDRAPSK
jgi:hypothetical protein